LIVYLINYIFKKKNFKNGLKHFYIEFSDKKISRNQTSLSFNLGFLFNIPYFSYILYAGFIFISIIISFYFGYAAASQKIQYVTYKTNANKYVIISTFNDEFLAVQLSNNRQLITNKIVFIHTEENKTFTVEDIGPLNSPEQNKSLYFIYSKLNEVINYFFLTKDTKN
jgi:hypothetical protein